MFKKVHMFSDKFAISLLGIEDPSSLGKYAIIPGAPKRVEKIIKYLKDVEKIGEVREHVTYVGYRDDVKVTVVSSGLGTPNAALTIEGLALAGVETVIRVGTTGAIQENINFGDLVIPTAAIRGDGVTREYVPYKFPAVADIDVVNALWKTAKKYNINVHRGIVWTHDALFMESKNRVEFWRSTGAISTEMECSAVFTVGKLRGLKAGAILAVDGNLIKKKQFGATGSKVLAEAIEKEIQIALDAAVELEKSKNV